MYKIIKIRWAQGKGSMEQELNKLQGQVIQLLGKPYGDGVRTVRQEYDYLNMDVLVNISKVEQGRSDRDEYLTIRECADFLKLSIPTIYAHCQRSSIPYMKRGKRLFFSKSELKKWLDSGRKGWENPEQVWEPKGGENLTK